MAVEEAKLQHLLLRDQLQEVVEAKCLHLEVLVVLEQHLLQEVTLEAEVHQEEVVQEDSSNH